MKSSLENWPHFARLVAVYEDTCDKYQYVKAVLGYKILTAVTRKF
jgi:hypothetical protein